MELLPPELLKDTRRLLQQQMKHAISADSGTIAALVHIDIDGFKLVNTSLGCDAGDQVLSAVCDRLRSNLGESDSIARTGSNEFSVFLANLTGAVEAGEAADRLLGALREPFQAGGVDVFVTASAGLSLYPEHSREVDHLQRYASLALQHARQDCRNTWQLFAPWMLRPAQERFELQSLLGCALERGEFTVNYQPLYKLNKLGVSPSPSSFEALLRWRHPQFGNIAPARFIPVAEGMGLIGKLGGWVLDQACADVRHWLDKGRPGTKIYVNVSAMQFVRPDFVATVRAALDRHGVPGTRLGIELTESILVRDVSECARKVGELRDLGVTTAIDDFGVGYSSLTYLQCLPVEGLKLDGSFVPCITSKPRAAAVMEAMIALGHRLHMDVVAECIETREQLDAVRAAGCDFVQGYLLGVPAPREMMFDRRAA